MAASARGPPSGAPQWPGSVFMSVFKGTALWREIDSEDSLSAAPLPLLLSHVLSVGIQYVDDVSSACLSVCASIYVWHVLYMVA